MLIIWKKKIGHGNVRKVKDKNAYLYIISSFKGLERVFNLINNKIRTDNKLSQINNILNNHSKSKQLNLDLKFDRNNNNSLDNHWLAGFTDADGSFQIKLLNRETKIEVRLNYQIDQKKKDLLVLIREFIGGNIGYRKNQDSYYYGSTSFGSARNVINYFDKYHLLSDKYLNYLKWKKAYLIIREKEHLNENGIIKLKTLKNKMNNSNKLQFKIES